MLLRTCDYGLLSVIAGKLVWPEQVSGPEPYFSCHLSRLAYLVAFRPFALLRPELQGMRFLTRARKHPGWISHFLMRPLGLPVENSVKSVNQGQAAREGVSR